MIQYQMCTVLGYSLRDYRNMTPAEVQAQLDAHLEFNRDTTAAQAEDTYTAGVSF